MSLLRAKAPGSREKRLDTLGAWLGPVSAASTEFAAEEIAQRIRTFSQSRQDDLLYALRILAGIPDSITVIHGPRGCAAAALYHVAQGSDTRWIVTDLDERDTIMGADVKLRKALLELYHRHHPSVLFIVGNPVIAINNDDIQSVVDELHEELGLPIVPVYVTGFSSQNAVSGYDTTLHAMLKYLVKKSASREKNETLNLLSVAEHPLDRAEAKGLLEELGIEVNLLPDAATLDAFDSAVAAQASAALSLDASEYLGRVLQEKYGVPLIEVSRPVGIGGTGRWLKRVAGAFGREQAAERLHRQKTAELSLELGDFSLRGIKVYLSLSSANAFSVLDLVEELGGEVSGVTITHLDRLHTGHLDALAARNPSLQIHVSDGQAFEELSILRALTVDLYLGDSLHLSQIARSGIPVVSLEAIGVVGYRGVARLVRRLKTALSNPFFGRSLSAIDAPYHNAWFRRSHNWHIKQEVK